MLLFVERLQRYDLLDRLSAGGMGEVFLGIASGEHGFEKPVAVKRILPTLARDPEFVLRFVAEAKLAVSLSHANIVQVFDLGRGSNELYLVMEYVDGTDVRQLLRAAARQAKLLPLGVVLHIAAEALKGLAYAHDRVDLDGHPRGVVHCDISPSNLLVSYAGEVKITDFGVAEFISLARLKTERKHVAGKLGYMAPEQLAGDPPDARTDLYALGVVLYEALTLRRLGARPEHASNAGEAVAFQSSAKAIRPEVPQRLDDLITASVSLDKERRPASARVMLAEIAAIARMVESAMTPPDVGLWARELVPPRRRTDRAAFDGALDQILGIPKSLDPLTAQARPVTRTFSKKTASFVVRSAAGSTVREWTPLAAPDAPARRGYVLGGGLLAALLTVGVWIVAREHVWNARRGSRASTTPAPAAASGVPSGSTSVPSATTSGADRRSENATPSAPRSPERPPKEDTAPGRSRARVPANSQNGYLDVYTEPWCYVIVDGKKVGTTPLARFSLAAGVHRIRLANPTLEAQTRTVRIEAGKTKLVTAYFGQPNLVRTK